MRLKGSVIWCMGSLIFF